MISSNDFMQEKRIPKKSVMFKEYSLVYTNSSKGYTCRDYDPLFSLGMILPSKLKKMNIHLKKRVKNFNPGGSDLKTCLITTIIIALIIYLVYYFVLTLIKFGKEGNTIGIFLAILVISVAICIISFTAVCLDSYFTKWKNDRFKIRRESLIKELQAFKEKDGLLKELNFLTFTVSRAGAYITMKFGDEVFEKVKKFETTGIEEGEIDNLAKGRKYDFFKIPEISVAVGGKTDGREYEKIQNDSKLDYPAQIGQGEPIPFKNK